MIKLQTYKINNLPLTNELLVIYINNFWSEIFNSIKDTSHLLILTKVYFCENEGGYRTLGHLRKVNFVDKDLFIEYLTTSLSTINDSYISVPISEITFSYIIKEGQVPQSEQSLILDQSHKVNASHNFNNLNLPISMNPGDYGEIQVSNYIEIDRVSYKRYIVLNGTKTFRIDRSLDRSHNIVTLLGVINLTWTDTKVHNIGADVFKREIKKSTIYFMDGEIVLRKQILPAKAFRQLQPNTYLNNDFYTMDIETINNGGKLVPYLITAYNGTDFLTSYNRDQRLLFTTFFDNLLLNIKPGSKTIIYAHNFSGFDGIFLMRHLLSYGKVEPLLFNGRLMSIKVIVGTTKSETKVIVFKDSYLLLPLSLRKLCVAFDVAVPKGHFPFLFKNIFYTGIIPKFEYWTGISFDTYESILNENKNKMWDFKQEAIKYCKLDCQTLHEIILKFNELIFNHFKIDAHKALTLPALAMRIYKTHYMPENTIYQLLGKAEFNIRESYTGGAVDVYIPHNRITEFFRKVKALFIKLYYYDVNSLYPFVMATFDMPVGKPVAFEGDIRKIDPNAFGFFNCKITSPANLKHPLLQRRIKTSEGVRTIAGLGSWTGWIFSTEMDNALKFGYQFEVLNGYEFEKGNIFSEYVTKMYNLRLQYEKGSAMNLIAKLLMNSLYGKFGMKLESTEIAMYDTSTEEGLEDFKDYIEIYGETIQDFVKIDNTFLTIRNTILSYKYNEKEDMFHGLDINIAIASAITAGARVHMSLFKNNPNFNLYYSDTDSAVIDRQLDSEFVGNKLGQMKLEHTINKAVFLAPKVYGLVDIEGNEILKVKGVTSSTAAKLSFNELESLLVKDSSKEFNQEKWYKKVIEGEITVTDMAYTLKVTSNKRAPIYKNINGIEIYDSTRPYNYNELIK